MRPLLLVHVMSDLGLHCLPMSLLSDARHKYVNKGATSRENLSSGFPTR